MAPRRYITQTWGIAPGNSVPGGKALKARFISSLILNPTHNACRINAVLAPVTHDILLEGASPKMNRTFSAGDIHFSQIPGALPQAHSECCAFGAKQMRVDDEAVYYWISCA